MEALRLNRSGWIAIVVCLHTDHTPDLRGFPQHYLRIAYRPSAMREIPTGS